MSVKKVLRRLPHVTVCDQKENSLIFILPFSSEKNLENQTCENLELGEKSKWMPLGVNPIKLCSPLFVDFHYEAWLLEKKNPFATECPSLKMILKNFAQKEKK
jgi:hypothetical protein